jgi:hypothetical protein
MQKSHQLFGTTLTPFFLNSGQTNSCRNLINFLVQFHSIRSASRFDWAILPCLKLRGVIASGFSDGLDSRLLLSDGSEDYMKKSDEK